MDSLQVRRMGKFFALLDVADQLQGRAVALFDVFLDVFFGAVLVEHAAIALVEAEGGQIVLVHDDDVFVIPFDESHIRLNQAGFRAVVALAGPRIKRSDQVKSRLRPLDRSADCLSQFPQIALLQQMQVLVDDDCGSFGGIDAGIPRQRQLQFGVGCEDRRKFGPVELVLGGLCHQSVIFRLLPFNGVGVSQSRASRSVQSATMGLNLGEQAFAKVATCDTHRVELADRLQRERQYVAMVTNFVGGAV